MNARESASSAGRKLYHAIWLKVKETFFDVSRLADWDSYEHRFDEQIDSEEAAINFASQALATLNDEFTQLLPREQSSPERPPVTIVGPDAEKIPNVTAVLGKSGIAYMRIMTFLAPNVTDEVEEGLKKIAACEGLILDLRHNVGGYMYDALDIAELFLKFGVLGTIETRSERGVRRRTVELKAAVCEWTDEAPDEEASKNEYKRRQPIVFGKPIAILVSDNTASAAELLAAVLIINGVAGLTVSVGKTTVGKGIGQELFNILDKVTLKITNHRYLVGPDGVWLGDCGQTLPADSCGIEVMVPVDDDTGPRGLEVAADEVRAMITKRASAETTSAT